MAEFEVTYSSDDSTLLVSTPRPRPNYAYRLIAGGAATVVVVTLAFAAVSSPGNLRTLPLGGASVTDPDLQHPPAIELIVGERCSNDLGCRHDEWCYGWNWFRKGKCLTRGLDGEYVGERFAGGCGCMGQSCDTNRCLSGKCTCGTCGSSGGKMEDLPSRGDYTDGDTVYAGVKVSSFAACKAFCDRNHRCKSVTYCDDGSGGRIGECWAKTGVRLVPSKAGCARVKNAKKLTDVTTRCANEGDLCACSGEVTYGQKYNLGLYMRRRVPLNTFAGLKSHKYKTKTIGTVDCTNKAFGGDPDKGYKKQCWCTTKQGDTTRFCSEEGKKCACSGHVTFGRKFASGKPGSGAINTFSQMLRIGKNKIMVSGSIMCDNSAMGGDPVKGDKKLCMCTQKATTPKGMVTAGNLCRSRSDCAGDSVCNGQNVLDPFKCTGVCQARQGSCEKDSDCDYIGGYRSGWCDGKQLGFYGVCRPTIKTGKRCHKGNAESCEEKECTCDTCAKRNKRQIPTGSKCGAGFGGLQGQNFNDQCASGLCSEGGVLAKLNSCAGTCIDKIPDGESCVKDHNKASYACQSGHCHGVHWNKVKVGGVGLPGALGPRLGGVTVGGVGRAYCMPYAQGRDQGFPDSTPCAYDTDCSSTSFCFGGGILPTWVGSCMPCPADCGPYGCHTCDNTNTSIKCNDGPASFIGQTLGCVPAAAENDWNKLQVCIANQAKVAASKAIQNLTGGAEAEAASKQRLKNCMSAAVMSAKNCSAHISSCKFEFDCLQFGDMLIASGGLQYLDKKYLSGGRRLLSNPLVQSKDISKAWLLRNFSRTWTLANGTRTTELKSGYSRTSSHSILFSLEGSAYFVAGLHIAMDVPKGAYDLTFRHSGIKLDLGMALRLKFNSETKRTTPEGTILTSYQELALTDATGGLCRDPRGTSCAPKKIYDELYTVGTLPVMVEVFYQVKSLVSIRSKVTAEFTALLNYSQFFGFEELGVVIGDGKAAWRYQPSAVAPNITTRLEGNVAGEIDFKALVGVELTVIVNGIEAQILVGAWGKLKGNFNVNMLLEGTGLAIGNEYRKVCISGKLNAGVAPGLRLKAGLGLATALQSFVGNCQPCATKICDNPYAKVADCFVGDVAGVHVCDDLNHFCQELGEQAALLINAPASEGYFPLNADTAPLKIQLFNRESCPVDWSKGLGLPARGD